MHVFGRDSVFDGEWGFRNTGRKTMRGHRRKNIKVTLNCYLTGVAKGYARNRDSEPGDEGRRGRPGRGRKMQPDRIRDSPLRTTKARKDRTRQAGAIRSELFMTSLLKGALETDTEISFYLPRSALTGLRCSKGVPYDPICLHLPSPARTAPPTFVFRLRLPIPGWFSLVWLKTMLLHWYLRKAKFT